MWFLAASAPNALFYVGPVAIGGSAVVTLIVAIGLIIAAQVVSRNNQPVPSGLNNFAEWIVESLYNFLADILGADLVRRTFWFFATLFIFILALNWFGLVPGVGTIGYGEGAHWWHLEMTRPFLRGANADLNLPAAMAAVFFVLWIFWALQANGPVGMAKHIFGPKAKFPGLAGAIMIAVFFAVGCLEVVSILIRPLALTLRLYGNVYGGEVLIESMMKIVPSLSWLIPLPFYFYELLIGLVQALVFCLLCAVFTAMICHPDEEEAH